MLSKEKLERVNELSRKKKEQGLFGVELEEHNQLRAEYVRAFRTQFEGHLQSMGMNKIPKRAHSCGCGCGHKH